MLHIPGTIHAERAHDPASQPAGGCLDDPAFVRRFRIVSDEAPAAGLTLRGFDFAGLFAVIGEGRTRR